MPERGVGAAIRSHGRSLRIRALPRGQTVASQSETLFTICAKEGAT